MANAEEAHVDVDAVLRQLKQAKDRELRLRAEKERVRKELDALRTGDLWSRETSAQRELEAVQSRRRALQAQETVETQRLHGLDEELREKEVGIHKQRRTPLDAIKQAAASILSAPVAAGQASGVSSTEPRLPDKPLAVDRDAPLPQVGVQSFAKPRHPEETVGSRRPPSNQDAADDAVVRLSFAIDLDKQQARIRRLEQQVEQTKAQQQIAGNVWDLPVLPGRGGGPQLARREKAAETLSSTNDIQQKRTGGADTIEDTLKEVVTTAGEQPPQALPPQVAAQYIPHTQQMLHEPSRSAYPGGGWTYPPRGIPGQPTQDPRFVYHHSLHPISPAAASIPPIVPLFEPQAMAATAYSMFPPSVVVPMVPPSIYSPWSFSPPFGMPSYGYPLPVLTQPPPFPPSTSFLQHPSPSYLTPPVDQEVVRLQRELDMLRNKERESDDDKEFTKVQELLTGLQHQVTQLTRAQSGDILTSEIAGDTPRTSAIAETKDPSLSSIKRQHLEAVLKVRNERDLLEEQGKLEEVQERVEKRREERKRDLTHEALVAKQKQELMALRLQRAITKLDAKKSGRGGLVPDMTISSRPYDTEEGVLLCWDFASGLLRVTENAQLTFAVYDGKTPRSPIKALVSKECESEGPNHKRVIFAANRLVKPLPASDAVVVVVEASSVVPSNSDSSKPTLRRLGWAAVNVFKRNRSASSSDLQLAYGWLKVKLSPTPMPDPTAELVQGSTAFDATVVRSGDVFLYFRIANGELEEQARSGVVDPDVYAGRYEIPESGSKTSNPPAQSGEDQNGPLLAPSVVHPPLAQSPIIRPNQRSGARGDVSDLPTNQSERNPPVAIDQPPPSRDFLDIERLRLLSSSSAASCPPSGLIRPQSTLSAVPRHRVGGGVGSLPAVPEASQFDDTSSTSPWIRVDKSMERYRRLARQLFQPGDAFNVYIDGARFLPDNVSVTKVTIAALNSDRSKVSPSIPEAISQVAAAASDARNPSYNLFVEYREKVFDPTLTLVIRVDTINIQSKEPAILAYASSPVFLDADSRTQPTRSNGVQYGLNDGAFQLPLYTNASVNDPTSGPLSAASVVASIPRLPCATLLIRVEPAMTSEDGLQVLSRRMFLPSEWVAQGLEVPAPPYDLGAYDSTTSIPTPLEMKMYNLRDLEKKKRSVSVQQALALLGLDASPVNSLFSAKPSSFVDLRLVYRYQPAIGFRVAVDGLHNIKVMAGGFCRVVFSVAPPGNFYRSIRLTSGVHFTTTMDWSSLPTSPEFQDGFVPLRDIPVDPRLVVVIDVRVVVKNPKTNAYQSQPLAWSFVPVLDDKTGAVAAGSFQIPLFTGEVKLAALDSSTSLSPLIDDIAAEKKKLILPFMGGASVFVRLEDPQVPSFSPSQPMAGATMSRMMPAKSIARYQLDVAKVALAKKKTPLSKQLPAGVDEKQMDAEINQAFAAEMGIPHY